MAPTEPGSSPSLGRSLLVLALLAGWAALLLAPAFRPPGLGAVALWDPRSLRGSAFDIARFAPLGLLAVLAFRDRGFRLARFLLVAVPALAVGLSVGALVVWLRDRSLGPPGPSDLLLPSIGVGLGVLVALSLRRGLTSLLLLPAKIAAVLLLCALLAVALVASALERGPALPLPRAVTTRDKRQLVAALRDKDPRQVPAGREQTLRLTEGEVERLIAWGLPLVRNPERTRLEVRFEPSERVRVRGSQRLPVLGRWLNLDATAAVGVRQGTLTLASPRLRLGPREIPPALLDALSPLLSLALRSERRLRPVLSALGQLEVAPGEATITYGRVSVPRGLLASLVWGEGERDALRGPVAAQVEAVLDAAASSPEGEQRLARAYEAAFTLARTRSGSGLAVEENRAAILALGIVLGSGRLTSFVGEVADPGQKARAAALRSKATLRGRADWTRHFSLSGALTVLSAVAPSDAAGLLKEELDADGGSGFSFGDLLADRAGTTFAAVATRDEASASAIQERVARGFDTGAFFPPPTGLPENIGDAELRVRYGGVGGPLYSKQVQEIERRVAACAGYR